MWKGKKREKSKGVGGTCKIKGRKINELSDEKDKKLKLYNR